MDACRNMLITLVVMFIYNLFSRNEVTGFSQDYNRNTKPSKKTRLKDKDREQSATYSTVSRILRERLRDEETYDKWVRPNDTGDAVEVLVEFKVMAFGTIREEDMDYSLDIFFRQWWRDERLAHDVDKVFNMAANPGQYFWTPDTYFVNVKSSKFHHVTRENMRTKIWPDGLIYYSSRITLTASCEMDLRFFPMDTQDCVLKIESYAYTVEDVIYNWNNRGTTPIEIFAGEMAQFDMTEVTTSKLESNNSKGSFDSLRVSFRFKRRTSYFIVQHYVPSAFIVFLSWLGFWINKNAVPARISLTVTCILSTMVLFESINSSLPRISYLKAVDYYLIISFMFILASMVEYVLVLNVTDYKRITLSRKHSLQTTQSITLTDVMDQPCHCRERSNGLPRPRRELPVPNGFSDADHVTNILPLQRLASHKQQEKHEYNFGDQLSSSSYEHYAKKSHFIDHCSKKVFPLLYALFNIVYWSYYLPQV